MSLLFKKFPPINVILCSIWSVHNHIIIHKQVQTLDLDVTQKKYNEICSVPNSKRVRHDE